MSELKIPNIWILLTFLCKRGNKLRANCRSKDILPIPPQISVVYKTALIVAAPIGKTRPMLRKQNERTSQL